MGRTLTTVQLLFLVKDEDFHYYRDLCLCRDGGRLFGLGGGSVLCRREHVLINGASTDGTLALLEAHRSALAVVVSEPDGGICDALNKGIALATGDIVGFLHADDLYADADVLARVAEAFADRAVEAVYGDLVYVAKEDTGRAIRHWRSGAYSRARLAWGWMPPHPTLYLRRSVYQRLGSRTLLSPKAPQ